MAITKILSAVTKAAKKSPKIKKPTPTPKEKPTFQSEVRALKGKAMTDAARKAEARRIAKKYNKSVGAVLRPKAPLKALKKLPKKPSNIKESADKARHHHAASVKALTQQQGVVRDEAKKAGMRVNAYKEKFSNKASVKKLKELQKQNETIRDKKFKKGGAVIKK